MGYFKLLIVFLLVNIIVIICGIKIYEEVKYVGLKNIITTVWEGE